RRPGDSLRKFHSPALPAIGPEIKTGQAGAYFEFDQVNRIVRLDAQIEGKDVAQAQRRGKPGNQRSDVGLGCRLRAGDRLKARLGIASLSPCGSARLSIKRHAVFHGLEIAARIDKSDSGHTL